MSQPPIDPTPEQQGEPQQPPAPAVPPVSQPPQYAPQPPHYAPPQYGQPQQPQYGQPQQPQFAPPQAPQYGQPQAPQYGQPQYGQPAYAAPAYQAQLQFPPAPVGTVPGPGGPFDGAVDPEDLTRPLYGATFGQATKRFFKQYANFSGRASRSEYWWVALLVFLIQLIPLILYIAGITMMASAASTYDSYNNGPNAPGLFLLIVGIGLLLITGLGLLLPSIAVAWRRLHDGNFAGPMYFLSLIPYAGGIILLVFMLLPSKAEGRRFDEVRS